MKDISTWQNTPHPNPLPQGEREQVCAEITSPLEGEVGRLSVSEAGRVRGIRCVANFLASLPIYLYRLTLKPFLGHWCRFEPTCSAYALEAIEKHGAFKGWGLALKRLMRCHPWGGHGYDPVP